MSSLYSGLREVSLVEFLDDRIEFDEVGVIGVDTTWDVWAIRRGIAPCEN